MQALDKFGLEALKRDRYLDFLDILLTAKDEDGEGLTYQEIRDEVDTFLFEGHDTTASAISWALYSLAEHPEYQTLCQEEIDHVLQGRSDDNIQWSDLGELSYLTMCIKEALRLHCPVPFIERETTKALTIDGVTLPARSLVDIQIYRLHHNAAVWPDSLEFRPTRFLPENLLKIDNFSFVPFSAGPRNCIGQHFAMHEMKIAIARILRKYNLALDAEFKVQKKVGVVMKTADGMYLKVSLRKDNATK
jgi:cytochrome P450